MCKKLLLEMYCDIASAPFHEAVSKTVSVSFLVHFICFSCYIICYLLLSVALSPYKQTLTPNYVTNITALQDHTHTHKHKQVHNYYKLIAHPIDMRVIRSKLGPHHFDHYTTPSLFIVDVLLLFANCAAFNSVCVWVFFVSA